ncbi:MAG: GNAT family N-acetyltransferase [Bacteroidota bacterium]
MNLHIYQGGTSDIGNLYELLVDFSIFLRAGENFTMSLETLLEEKDSFSFLLATCNGIIVGFAIYTLSFFSWSGKTLFLDDLYVIEEFRGKKIGTALFERLVIIASEKGCTKIRWQVPEWNDKAISFYQKRGGIMKSKDYTYDLFI